MNKEGRELATKAALIECSVCRGEGSLPDCSPLTSGITMECPQCHGATRNETGQACIWVMVPVNPLAGFTYDPRTGTWRQG